MCMCAADIPHMNNCIAWLNIVEQVNRTLQLLVPSVCELRSDYKSLESCTETADRDNVSVFLSRLNLDEYYVAEERFTQALVGFTKKQFFEVSMLPLLLKQIELFCTMLYWWAVTDSKRHSIGPWFHVTLLPQSFEALLLFLVSSLLSVQSRTLWACIHAQSSSSNLSSVLSTIFLNELLSQSLLVLYLHLSQKRTFRDNWPR